MNAFSRFHYDLAFGSLEVSVNALNTSTIAYITCCDVTRAISFCSVCVFQFVQLGLRCCSGVKGVHTGEAEQQESALILTEYL